MTALSFTVWLVVAGAVAGILHGLAAVIRAWFQGQAELIRAKRGDPQPDSRWSSLPAFPKTCSREREG